MRAAIFGCGYVGRRVAQRWREAGYTVTATTTTAAKVAELEPLADRVVVCQGDDQEQMGTVLADQQVLLVCVGAGRHSSYADTYLKTAETVAALLPETPIEQVIFTSTYSVYGDHGGAWVSEEMPVRPATENGKVLVATEQTLLQMATPQRRVCVLRLGGIYGPGRELSRIFARAAGTTRAGAGAEGSNWVHVEDIVGAIACAADHRLSGLYNLVQDEIPTVRQLIERVGAAHGLEPVRWDESQPSTRPYNLRAANQKLKAAGYTFVHPTFGSAIAAEATHE